MISGINGVFKVNVAKKIIPDFGGYPGVFEFWNTKIFAQFKNYGCLNLAMMNPQYTNEITRKSIQLFL